MSNSMVPFNGQGTWLISQITNSQTGQCPYPNGYQQVQNQQQVFPNTVVGYHNGLPITQTMNESMLANQLKMAEYNRKCQARVEEFRAKQAIQEDNRLKRENRGVSLRKNSEKKLCTLYKDLNDRERIGDPVCDIVDLRAMKLVSHFRGKDYAAIWLIDDFVNRLIKSSENGLLDVETENLWFIPDDKANSKTLAKFLSQVGHGIQTHRHDKEIIYDLVYQFVLDECANKVKNIPFTTGWVKYSKDSWAFVPEGTMTMRGILGL